MSERAPANWDAGDFVGGALCLDFCNTVSGSFKDRSAHSLASHAHLSSWARHAGAIDESTRSALSAKAQDRPELAARVLTRAIVLRETLFRIFSAIAAGQDADAADIEALNRALHEALSHAAVSQGAGAFAWGWRETDQDLESPLWPIVWSAAQLLTDPELALLRECGRCSWLFLDRSKNRRRRWCKMAACGNRTKSQRHYRRVTGGSSPPP